MKGVKMIGIGSNIIDPKHPECLVNMVYNGVVAKQLTNWGKFFRVCFQILRDIKEWDSEHNSPFPLETDRRWKRFTSGQQFHFHQLQLVYAHKDIPTDDDECWKQFQETPADIVRMSGIRRRPWLKPGADPAQLAVQAIDNALAASSLKKTEVEMVIVATTTHLFKATPPSASEIINKAGIPIRGLNGALRHIKSFDISNACSSFASALSAGFAFIHAGMARNCIVVGLDIMTTTVSPYDRYILILLGDGAIAAVLKSCDPSDSAFQPNRFTLGTDGSFGNLIKIQAGGSVLPVTPEMIWDPFDQRHMMGMDGNLVTKNVNRLLLSSGKGIITDALEEAGLDISQIKIICPHQANIRMLKILEERLIGIGYTGIFYKNVSRFGNLTSPSAGYCLYEAWQKGHLKEGDLVMLLVFGGGLTWGIVIFRWTLGKYSKLGLPVSF